MKLDGGWFGWRFVYRGGFVGVGFFVGCVGVGYIDGLMCRKWRRAAPMDLCRGRGGGGCLYPRLIEPLFDFGECGGQRLLPEYECIVEGLVVE